MSDELTLDQAQELFEFLKGEKIPEGFTLPSPPKLCSNQAFSVIYVLQEHFHVIPDNFELCCNCDMLFDSNEEGTHHEDSGNDYCGGCF